MNRFDPMTIFPLFVFFIVILGILYATLSRQRFMNEAIALSTPKPSSSTATDDTLYTPTPPTSPSPTTFLQTNSNQSTSNIEDLRYPNSKQTSSSSTHLELITFDSPNKITDWYKTKLKALGLNTHSAVSTNTNNNIYNSLESASNNLKLKVEIKRDSGSNETKIIIDTL